MTRKAFVCCSQCFETNEDVKHKFFITNCYHVFCARCIANEKNVCLICKKKCKILTIDSNLPKEVKSFFDPRAHINILQNLVKIMEFQQNHMKAYIKRHYMQRQNYNLAKQKVQEYHKKRMAILEDIKREKSFKQKLKDAYRSNMITPHLFQYRSPQERKSQSHNRGTPEDVVMSSSSLMSYSTSGISSNLKNDVEQMEISDDFVARNYHRDSNHQPKNILSDVRKELVACTLHDMKKTTQTRPGHADHPRSQLRGSQFRPY